MTQQVQTRVTDAQARLASAERDFKAEQLETMKQQLVAVRAEGRKLKDELEKLVREVRQLDADIALEQADLAAFGLTINEHFGAKPDPVDFPSDSELAAWQTELSRLESGQLEQSRRVTELTHQRAYPLQQALDLDAALTKLRTQQVNLERIVRGEALGWPQGGINRV